MRRVFLVVAVLLSIASLGFAQEKKTSDQLDGSLCVSFQNDLSRVVILGNNNRPIYDLSFIDGVAQVETSAKTGKKLTGFFGFVTHEALAQKVESESLTLFTTNSCGSGVSTASTSCIYLVIYDPEDREGYAVQVVVPFTGVLMDHPDGTVWNHGFVDLSMTQENWHAPGEKFQLWTKDGPQVTDLEPR